MKKGRIDDARIVYDGKEPTRTYVTLNGLEKCDRSATVEKVSSKIEKRHEISPKHHVIDLPRKLMTNYHLGEGFLFCYEGSALQGIVTVSDLSEYAFLLAVFALLARSEELTRLLITTHDRWWLTFKEKHLDDFSRCRRFLEEAKDENADLPFSFHQWLPRLSPFGLPSEPGKT